MKLSAVAQNWPRKNTRNDMICGQGDLSGKCRFDKWYNQSVVENENYKLLWATNRPFRRPDLVLLDKSKKAVI